MFHLTLFSSAEASLTHRGSTALTLFGTTVLRAPTLAQRVVRLTQQHQAPTRWDRLLGRDRSLMVTLFGNTQVALPSLLDEWTALRQLAGSNDLPRDRIRTLCDRLRTHDPHGLDLATLTLFGCCQVVRPSAKRELAGLQRAEKAGTIDGATRNMLEALVGRGEPAILGGLVDVALA